MNEYYRDCFLFLGLLLAVISNTVVIAQVNIWWGWLAWIVSLTILIALSIGFLIKGIMFDQKRQV